MPRLAVDKRPRGSVEPRIRGERTVVKVDGTLLGERQEAVRQYGKVDDAEKVVEGVLGEARREVGAGCKP